MIVNHPTLCFAGPFGGSEPCKVVKCSFCGKLASPGNDIDGALDGARKSGFTTVPGRHLSDPRNWSCYPCRESKGLL